MKLTVPVVAALLLTVLDTRPAYAAPPDDPVAAGYAKWYGGERDGAARHFETLHTQQPDNLAVWHALLFARVAQIENEAVLETAFEHSIDRFLERADQRYARSRADA